MPGDAGSSKCSQASKQASVKQQDESLAETEFCIKHVCVCVQGAEGNRADSSTLLGESFSGSPSQEVAQAGERRLRCPKSQSFSAPKRQRDWMGSGCLAFFSLSFKKTQFPSFVYELRGGVYQSWKMPQRGSDQRQTLKCVLRWISLPNNTLM